MSDGHGFIRSLGWESKEEANFHGAPKPRFRAIIEWVDEPPALPLSILFDEIPVMIVPVPPQKKTEPA